MTEWIKCQTEYKMYVYASDMPDAERFLFFFSSLVPDFWLRILCSAQPVCFVFTYALHFVFHFTFSGFCFVLLLFLFCSAFPRARSISFLPQLLFGERRERQRDRESDGDGDREQKKQIESHHEQISLWLLLLDLYAPTIFISARALLAVITVGLWVQFNHHNRKPLSLFGVQTNSYVLVFSNFGIRIFVSINGAANFFSFRQSRYLIQLLLDEKKAKKKKIMYIFYCVFLLVCSGFGFIGSSLRHVVVNIVVHTAQHS